MASIIERAKNAWSAFFNNRDPSYTIPRGQSSFYRPDRPRIRPSNERTIISAIYNKIAVDASSVDIEHVRLDEDRRYSETIKSPLNTCLTLSSNLDQDSQTFKRDIVLSMLDEGCVAVVPTSASANPATTDSYDIYSLRVGKITEWFPNDIRVELYNESKGRKEEVIIPKRVAAIIENPFYTIMNEPNSTLRRLALKLSILDVVDSQVSSGKLDLLVQLPFALRTENQKLQAKERQKEIEMQLAGTKYGIAYIDATEKVTQLNRPVENNLLSQIEYLTKLLFSQLGITEEILNGTANEQTMVNYQNRIIEPILNGIVLEMQRKWLSKTAISQGQAIRFFRNPFKFTTISQVTEFGEKAIHNEIMSPNEVRGIIGMKPSSDPSSDTIANRDLYPDNSGANNDAQLNKYDSQLNQLLEEVQNA